MATVQETIDNLISYIDAAVAKHSVSNRHVATVLAFLNNQLRNINDRYLRKDTDDVAHGNISFEKDISVGGNATVAGDHSVGGKHTIGGSLNVDGSSNFNDDVTIGEYFEQGDKIQGARIRKDGMASFAGINSPSMQIYELIYNRKTAVQGDFVFSDGDTIEKVEFITDDGASIDSSAYNNEEYSYIRLTVKEQYEGYITTFKQHDILYSNVNLIGESGDSAKTGKCWMYVLAENNEFGVPPTDGLVINAAWFGTNENVVPAGVNMLPTPHMVITRHGNLTNKDRQNVFIISSETGALTQLMGVDAPIVSSEGSYGIVLGLLPDTLREYIEKQGISYLNPNQPYLYARGIIAQDIIRVDYQGKPVLIANYRGHWSEDIAKGNVEGESKYLITAITFDTVTHKGALWACMVSETTVEPSDNAGEWVKQVYVEESESAKYDIIPSVNIIYYRTATDTLSTNSVDVKIGVQTFHGNYEITSQSLLDEKGLGVYYAIDGVFENAVKLNISPVALLQLEDGSAILATESGNELSLEGDDIDVASIKDNITLYLIEEATGEELAKYIIPVTKDGQQGDKGADGAGYSVYVDTPIISHPIDPKTKATIGSGTYQVEVQVLNNGTPLATENILPIYALHGSGVTVGWTQNEKSYTFIISIPADLSDEQRTKRVELYFYGKAGYEFSSGDIRGNIAIAYLERGADGAMGKEGALPYLCGTWIEEAAKAGAYPPATDIASVVLHKEAYYVRNSNPYPKDAEGNDIILAPDVDWGTSPAATRCWRLLENYEAAFFKIVMAQFAQLAQAVFHGDYMFSVKGVTNKGTEGEYSAFVDDKFGNEPMFEDVGADGEQHHRLSGSFVPNLFLDFKSGEAKVGKLSETYTRITAKEYAGGNILIPPLHVVNLDSCHNVSCQAVMNDVDGTCAVLLPKASNGVIVDGTHSIIVHEYNAQFSDRPTDENYSSSVVAVCADESMLYPDTDFSKLFTWIVGDDTNKSSDGWFIWRGYRTKLVLLTPGSMLQLRSCVLEDGGMVWFIENSSDFEILNASFSFYQDYDSNTGAYTFSSNDTTSIEAIYRSPIVLGSPAINHIEGGGYDEGIVTSWVWNATGNLAEDTNNTGEDGYRGCYIMERRDIL